MPVQSMRNALAVDAERERRGVTKQAVADRLGLSWEGANKKLTGQTEFSLSELVSLADWWGVCLDQLVARSVPACPGYSLPARGEA